MHSYRACVKSKNITLKIDEVTYRKARIRAARMGTSVSALVRDFLASDETEADDPEAHRIDSLRALYRKAERRARSGKTEVEPLRREAIYADRLR